MVLGLSIATFTILHVIISLIAIVIGLIVAFAMVGGSKPAGWTALFLLTTLLTSVTGFLFPIVKFTPALGTGIISVAVLAVAIVALYGKHLMGAWRWIYVVAAMASLYLNVFVLVVQAFLKVPFLRQLAPKGNEPPFLIAQTVVLVLFVALGIVAVIRFRPTALKSV
jgi:hypothetical protein